MKVHNALCKSGLSLVEVVISIAITALLIGLLLPALQQVRASSLRTSSANNMRQIGLALHQYAAVNAGKIPGPRYAANSDPTKQESGIHNLIEFLGVQASRPPGNLPADWRWFKPFMSPADSSIALLKPESDGNHGGAYICSYAQNISATANPPTFESGFIDGTSYTIYLADRYCFIPYPEGVYPKVFHIFDFWTPYSLRSPIGFVVGSRRASYADAGYFDVVPITSGNPAVSRPSSAGVTFQAKPPFNDCDVHQLQSPYANGLQVAMFDGSVRFLRKEISETAFWGMTTRDAGDIAE